LLEIRRSLYVGNPVAEKQETKVVWASFVLLHMELLKLN